MYIPDHFRPTENDVASLLANIGAADLISATDEGILATFLPLIQEVAGSAREPGASSGRGCDGRPTAPSLNPRAKIRR